MKVVQIAERGAFFGEEHGSRNMRIGIYKDTLANRRGADMAVLALAEGLCERGYDAAVFEKPDLERCVAEPWDVVISTGTNELLDLSNCFSGRPARTAPFPVPRFPFPIIQQFHTNPRSQFKWKRFVRNWKIRCALKRVSAIQVLSEAFIPQIAKYGVPVCPIGNWSRFQLSSPTPISNSHSHSNSHSNSHSTIIYPAAFAKGKNQKLLIRAFAQVAAEFPAWKLRLLGRVEGRYAEECRKLAAKLGETATNCDCPKIEFAGYCENLTAEYESCAFVAFPSRDEGFGLAIADAAAFAKPCVMVKDWIGTAGCGEQSTEGGIVTKPTVKAYAEGLRRLMADAELRRRMGERARTFCAERYSRERILDQWETLIKETARAC